MFAICQQFETHSGVIREKIVSIRRARLSRNTGSLQMWAPLSKVLRILPAPNYISNGVVQLRVEFFAHPVYHMFWFREIPVQLVRNAPGVCVEHDA